MNISPQSPISHGTVTRSLTVDGFGLTYTNHGPNQEVGPHSHGVAALTIALRGSFREVVENRALECRIGSVLFKAADVVHANRYSRRGARSLIIEVPVPALDRLSATMPLRNVVAEVTEGIPWARAMRLHRAVQRASDAASLDAEELVCEILGSGLDEASRARSRAPRWVDDIRDRLESDLADVPSLVTLAEDAGVHPVYLARAFRRRFGCSVGEWVQRRRIDRAVVALVRTEEPIARVGIELGFYDQPHFTRWFRRLSGYTPAAFREMARARR